MAAYTSSQAGNWSSSSTWGGAGVPTVGDTASIGHVVTVDVDTTVGTSPDNTTTFVITVTNNGQILIPTGITLTALGNINLNPTSVIGVNLQINGSGRLYFDGSAVSTTRRYLLQFSLRARARLAGTDAANRATIEANPASGVFQFALNGSAPNLDIWSFATVNRAGDATLFFAGSGVSPTSNVAGAGQSISWTDVTLNKCGRMAFTATDPGSLTLTNVINNSAFIARTDGGGNESQGVHINCSSGSGIVATISNCVFDCGVYFQGSQFMSVANCYCGYGMRNAVGNTGFASSSNIFTTNRFVQSRTWYGSLRDCYWFHYTIDNQNYFINQFIPTSGADEISNIVLDHGDTSPLEPDGLAIFNLPTGTHYSVSRIFYLPDSAGVSAGAWFNVYPDPSNLGTCSFEHNTLVSARGSGGENCLKVGERPARTGMITSYKSNLIWTPAGKVAGAKIARHVLSTDQDIVSAVNADYNWGWNLASLANQYSFVGPAFFSTGTPDVNGGSGDPQFVDISRNLIRFDIDYLGNAVATPWADATAYAVGDVVSASDTDYFNNETINWRCILAHTSAAANSTNGKPSDVSGFRTNWEPMSMYRLREDASRIALLKDWVRAGYNVANSSLDSAGHDGATIGAGFSLREATVSQTELDDISSTTGSLLLSASASQSEVADTVSQTATTTIIGSVAQTELSDTVTQTGSVTITGLANQTELGDISSESGTILISAVVNQQELDDITDQSANIGSNEAVVNQLELPDTYTGTGSISLNISGSQLELPDTQTATSSLTLVATVSHTELPDIVVQTGLLTNRASATQTELSDISLITGEIPEVPEPPRLVITNFQQSTRATLVITRTKQV